MEPIEVVVRFKDNGRIEPVSFTSNGVTRRVFSTGRQWRDDHGYHILIMVSGGRAYELNFDPVPMAWYLRAIGPERGTA